MPIYQFACYDCEKVKEIFKTRCEPPKTPKCEKCGQKMSRVYGTGVDATMKENVRYSYSMAISPNRVAEAMKAYPGSEYVVKGKVALLKINSREHKKFEMRRRGYGELE